jgi:hypothetical protein
MENNNTANHEYDTTENNEHLNEKDLMDQLLQEKLKFIQEGNYIEAEHTKIKIKMLKEMTDGQKKKDLSDQHAAELKQLEENYNHEMIDFQEVWDKRQKDFEDKANKEEETLGEIHQKEIQHLYNQLDNILPKVYKHSVEYLDLKKIEAGLVKQERFLEANKIKIKADAVAKLEEEKFNRERNDKIKKKVDFLIKKQQSEKATLREKITQEFEYDRKIKENELEKIIHKYKNKKLELDLQQKQEKNLNENTNMLRASNKYLKLNRNLL